MILDNLKMYPYCTTLMGVVKGALDYYGIQMSEAMAMGGSGHAFIMNIHNRLCPSGPYCWDMSHFFRLLKNLGLDMVPLGFYSETNSEDRKLIKEKIIKYLDSKTVCSLLNLENQIIYGYEDSHFLTAQPWPQYTALTPGTLTFDDWHEFGDEVHVTFFAIKKTSRSDDRKIIKDSLEYAHQLLLASRNTGNYAIGTKAYENWITAVENDCGSSHGNWWNGMVWSECRRMASQYFSETAGIFTGGISQSAKGLSFTYNEIALLLQDVSDKELDAAIKIKKLKEAKEKELSCANAIQSLLAGL